MQQLYDQKFLPLAKSNAPVEDIRDVDDQMDKLIDQYDELVKKIATSLQAEADDAQKAYDEAQSRNLKVSISVALAAAIALVAFGISISRGIRADLGAEPGAVRTILSALRDGDLTVAISREQGDQTSVVAAVDDMRNRLRDVIQTVRQGSNQIQTAATEVASGNQELSSRTEATASSLEQTASSMEEITATVRQSADASRQANQLASTAAAVAAKGGEVVDQVVGSMRDIQQSSQRIADIISVIDGIAFQTNILALNAAVEAARAGEQGRGFAVVAGEVRSLAQRSANAAKEIKDLITTSVERVHAGTAQVESAGQTMAEIVTSVQRVSDIIGEITTAAMEQSNGISQVNVAVTQLDQMTQQNATLVEQSAAAAQRLRDQATRLTEAVSVFNTGQGVTSASASGISALPTRVVSPMVEPPKAKRSAAVSAPRPSVAQKALPARAPVRMPEQTVARRGTSAPTTPSRAIAPPSDGDWETF
jgi:methyl-accepting chemotaxis protein